MPRETTGQVIRRWRQEAQLTQEELADLAGISQKMVSHIELDHQDLLEVGLRRVLSLCAALRHSLSDLETSAGLNFGVSILPNLSVGFATIVIPLILRVDGDGGSTVAVVVPSHLEPETLVAHDIARATVHRLPIGTRAVFQRAARVRRGQVVLVQAEGEYFAAYAMDDGARHVKVTGPVTPGGSLILTPSELVGRLVAIHVEPDDLDAPEGFL